MNWDRKKLIICNISGIDYPNAVDSPVGLRVQFSD